MANEIDIYQRLKSDRGTFDDHWQRLGEIMHPIESDFISQATPGDRRNTEIFDSTPLTAARDLSSAIDSLLKPRTQQWFHLLASDSELNDIEEVKIWLEEVENRMFSAIYQRETQFVHSSGSVDLSLVVFGTGAMFIGETRNMQNLSFRHMALKDTYLMRNADGMVDTLYIERRMTAKQADEFFEGKPGKTAKSALESDKKPEKVITYLQNVMPRNDRDPSSLRAEEMPFASKWFDIQADDMILDRGFLEFPFVVPVWDLAFDENYGRSPGMDALPDANTLNAQAKTILKAGQKVVDPPLLIGDDSLISAPRTWPGGITYFNMETARDLGRVPIIPLDTGANVQLGFDMLTDMRNQVKEAFLTTRLKLPIDHPQMTATEVLERKQEFIQGFGPIFGRLETDYMGPLIDRVFNIMFRAGAFPQPPEILLDRDVRFEYVNPIARSKRQLEAAAILRTAEILTPFQTVDPTIADNFNGDNIAQGVAEAQGVPLTWLNSSDQRAAIRQSRAEQAAALEEERQLANAVEQGATLAQAGATV